MSATAMQSTYPTQHCGCDFCGSRRSVNAKKLAVSQMAAQRASGCNCNCHTKGTQRSGGATFDPEHPEPVNQTALNASRGRNGVSGGNPYTIQNRSTRPGTGGTQGSGNDGAAKETAEQRQAREAAELDALERLLILEYKARTRATMEAERLRGTSANASSRRPQPLPEGYAEWDQTAEQDGYGADSGTWGGRGGSAGSGRYGGQRAGTIHEAYAMAQDCPVTPPAHCHASHRLQDTLEDVRKVTVDPVNPANRHALQRLLNKNGMGEEGGSETSSVRAGSASGAGGAGESRFGSSLAQIRTSNSHPRGAGVVWVSTSSSTAAAPQGQAKDTDVLVVDSSSARAASGSAKRPPPLSPGAAAASGGATRQAAGERHVTYAA